MKPPSLNRKLRWIEVPVEIPINNRGRKKKDNLSYSRALEISPDLGQEEISKLQGIIEDRNELKINIIKINFY